MTRQRAALVAALLGALLVAYALFSRESDEERIVSTLTELEQLIGFSSPPNVLARTASLNGGFKSLVSEDVRVEVPERGFLARGRAELARRTAQGSAGLQSFELDFSDMMFEIGDATATVEANVIVEASVGSERRRDERRVSLQFEKYGSAWFLARARVHEPPAED